MNTEHRAMAFAVGFIMRGSPNMYRNLLALLTVTTAQLLPEPVYADGDLPTKFINQSTIGNTRHNLTQRQTAGGGPAGFFMDFTRNDYGEVCVYCHTPHGANTAISVPLWNRTVRATTYTLYNQASLSGDVVAPGPNSLACLSCHDGQTAMDSIVNMPGSGRYLASQMTTQNNAFLSTWQNASGASPSVNNHNALSLTGCLSCHSTTPGAGGAADFSAAVIGTDLTNDHPIGVALPTGTDWNQPNGVTANSRFFDLNSNGRMDKDEIRFYDSGNGARVECASCHDPHGVPMGGPGSTFNPTFLRVSNSGSAVCMTCHVK